MSTVYAFPAPAASIDPEVAATMRRWDVDEELARAMIEVERLGVSWARPRFDSPDDDYPTAA